MSLEPPLPVYLFNLISGLRDKSAKGYPMKKVQSMTYVVETLLIFEIASFAPLENPPLMLGRPSRSYSCQEAGTRSRKSPKRSGRRSRYSSSFFHGLHIYNLIPSCHHQVLTSRHRIFPTRDDCQISHIRPTTTSPASTNRSPKTCPIYIHHEASPGLRSHTR